MPKSQQAKIRTKQKKLARRRKRLDRRKQCGTQLIATTKVSPKLADKLSLAHEMIDDGRFDKAEELLSTLAGRHARNPAVFEMQVYLYQETQDHAACCKAAKRWVELQPHDPDGLVTYAQESLLCGRASIALVYYRRFLERWPNHPYSQKARNAIEICQPECERRIGTARAAGHMNLELENGGLELYAKHEMALEQLGNGKFPMAISLCQEILETEPKFISARNNLATCYYQIGEVDAAIDTLKATCELAPDNRFAEATLAKFSFLTGQFDEANAIADRIMDNPPSEQDALLAGIEMLSYLGRDEDVITLCAMLEDLTAVDDDQRAISQHYAAVAHCRLGDEERGKSLWRECLKVMPSHPQARANLDDLESNEGHAPWAEPLVKWIPKDLIANTFERVALQSGDCHIMDECPSIALLLPALLDRGDPDGREFAFRLADADRSPAALESLRQFAFGRRGPDAMRHRALMVLYEENLIGAGPHRFFSHGEWNDIKVFAPKIYFDAEDKVEPWESELAEIGTEAMNRGDYDAAERAWQQTLERNPESRTAAYNQAVVWMQRDGRAGKRRAEARMREIYEQHPDYLFALIGLASFAASDGDCQRASELLGPVMERQSLHASEATALFTAQVQIAVKLGNLSAAEQAHALLVEVNGPDHPTVVQLRQIINVAKQKSRKLFRWF